MSDHPKEDFTIDPELDSIWKKHGRPKFFFPRRDNMAESRRLHSMGSVRFMKSKFVKETLGSASPRPWTEEDRQLPVRDGTSITIRIYRPRLPRGPSPVMVFSHSGGWCMGSLDTEEFICQLLCIRLNLVIFSVGYRLAPEYPYPTGCYDVFDTIKWVATNAASFGGDLSQGFITGGVSGGGNHTVEATILARNEGLQPKLTGHVYICTGMPHDYQDQQGRKCALYPEKLTSGSWARYRNGPVANYEMNMYYADLANCNAHDPLFSPLTLSDFSGLGPIYYQIAGMDMWADSAFFYCDKVQKAGGTVKIDFYPGVFHCWYAFYPELTMTKKWARDLINGVEWLLRKKGDEKVLSRI
ncbi:hypothetical protein H2204_001148 [Knufia peltigerae]|uniref:Alpha/beta hydrolase fold-3 domain-containing protein n=1 Tax=Knufia peltigerae TaxID=1002370 RepID=A0AA38YDZ6_9EURO|nr:hypothetical protein H2204_001148 [Knufia peltigerae]